MIIITNYFIQTVQRVVPHWMMTDSSTRTLTLASVHFTITTCWSSGVTADDIMPKFRAVLSTKLHLITELHQRTTTKYGSVHRR